MAEPDFDVAVVGAGFAGLAAALQLGRARRRVVLFDGGPTRNAVSPHAHGFLSRDGERPEAILAAARAQLATYPTVERVAERVETILPGPPFRLERVGGTLGVRRLVLAFGVRDRLPDVPGLAPLWGTGVFHCPYCHAYEVADLPLGVLGDGPGALHQALMLPDWSSDVLLFTNGPSTLDEAARARLARRGVPVEETPVARIVPDGGRVEAVELADGRRVLRAALLVRSEVSPGSALASHLGLALQDGFNGPFVKTDERRETNVPGVFAAGDLARPMHSVALAAADGATAGAMAHQSLLAEDWQ